VYLFTRNKNVDLFNSLQIIRAMFNNGEGVESLIKNIADRKYGYISKQFNKIILRSQAGQNLEMVIEEMMQKEKNKFFKYLLSSLKLSIEKNIDVNYTIDQIEQQIIQEQKGEIDKYINRTNRTSLFTLYVAFLPFLYIIIEVINWVMTDFFEDGEAIIDDKFRIGFFTFCLIALLIMTIMSMYND